MIDSAEIKAQIIHCLRAGPTRWAETAVELSAPAYWLCEQVERGAYDGNEVASGFYRHWGSEIAQEERQEMERAIREAVDVLSAQWFGYKRWSNGRSPAICDSFPADRLISTQGEIPLEWQRRWIDCGGTSFAGEFIALKNDPVWARFSDFGQPYPPFEWAARLDRTDIGRVRAKRLGIIQEEIIIKPKTSRSGAERRARQPQGCAPLLIFGLVLVASILAT